MPNPKTSDWIGKIKKGEGVRLHVEGGMTMPTAMDFHNGQFEGNVIPEKDTLSFVDDDEDCRVRMQRIGRWLFVVDNSGSGGAGVSYTGLYRRKQ